MCTYRCVVDVKVRFFYTLAVITLRVGQTKKALFEEVTVVAVSIVVPKLKRTW